MSAHMLHQPLPNGSVIDISMPSIGLGLYQCPAGTTTERIVTDALEAGYRHFDTAAVYRNEADVGRALRASSLQRSDYFVTTKIWRDGYGRTETLVHLQRCLEQLQLDYTDQVLIHAPPDPALRLPTWEALIEGMERGYTRTIGVSNFGQHHLQELFDHFSIRPVVNQIEVSPYCTREDLTLFCAESGIHIVAYSPLTRGKKLNDPPLLHIASTYGKTAAQVLIRWAYQKGFIVIPKSVHLERMKENINVFDFELSDAHMQQLDQLNEHLITGWDPTVWA